MRRNQHQQQQKWCKQQPLSFSATNKILTRRFLKQHLLSFIFAKRSKNMIFSKFFKVIVLGHTWWKKLKETGVPGGSHWPAGHSIQYLPYHRAGLRTRLQGSTTWISRQGYCLELVQSIMQTLHFIINVNNTYTGAQNAIIIMHILSAIFISDLYSRFVTNVHENDSPPAIMWVQLWCDL